MGSDYSKMTTIDQAHHFLDATIDMWGCDREEVNGILEEVKNRGIHDQFANTLWSFGADKDTGDTYEKLLKKYGDNLVASILKDELSGSGLNKALSLWKGMPVEHAQGWAARWQGVKDAVNGLGVINHKHILPFIDEHPYASWAVATAGGTALYYGGAYVVKAVPYVAGAFALYESAKIGKNEIDAMTTWDPAKKEKSLEKSGEGMGNLGMIVVTEGTGKGLSYGFRFVKGMKTAGPAIELAEEAEAFPLVTVKKPASGLPLDPTITMDGVPTLEMPTLEMPTSEFPTLESPTLESPLFGDSTLPGTPPLAARMSAPEKLFTPIFEDADASASGTKRIKGFCDATIDDPEPFAYKSYWSGHPVSSGLNKKAELMEQIADTLIGRLEAMESGKGSVDIDAIEIMGQSGLDRLKDAAKIFAASGDEVGMARIVSKVSKLTDVVLKLENRYGAAVSAVGAK